METIQKTPKAITVISVVGTGISAFMVLSLILVLFYQNEDSSILKKELIQKYGPSYLVSASVLHVLYFISYFGLWRMRKWGAIMYTVVFTSSSVLLLLLFKFNTPTLFYIYSLIALGVIFKYFKQMT